MNNKKNSISYFKHWASDGTVYGQTVNITPSDYDVLLQARDAELVLSSKPDNYEYNLYIRQPLERKGSLVFINLTQRDFFNKFLKLKLKDRNTCFNILK